MLQDLAMPTIEARFDRFERLLDTRFDALDLRFERLDKRLTRHFSWLVGLQVTTLAAILGALLARP
jgi:hypothetical protein